MSNKTELIHLKRKQNDFQEEEEEEEEDQPVKRKRIIVDDEEKHEYNCRKRCSKHSCLCFKSKNACNSSCKCKKSCKNFFNHLDYIFGENSQCSPHPCFADWLIKNIKTSDRLLRNDRDALRKKIEKNERYLEIMEEADRLADTQSFFRMHLSDEASPYYYSFCFESIVDEDRAWHCTICKGCRDSREWHCDGCNQCVYGSTSPCPRCEENEDEDEDIF